MKVIEDNKNNGESSDEYDETENLLMQKEIHFKLGDKIYINKGEL